MLQVIFNTPKSKFVLKVSKDNYRIANADVFEDDLRFVWIMNQGQGVKTYSVKDVLEAVGSFYNVIKEQFDLIQYRYGFKHLIQMGGKAVPTGCRGMSVQIEGKHFSMESGAGYCYRGILKKTEDGRFIHENKTDLRRMKRIDTDSWGPVEVLKRKIKLTWLEDLPRLLEFLKACDEPEVEVRTIWGKPSFAQLLAAHREGFGMDDWALEEIGNMGDEGKAKLIEKLKDPKAHRQHAMVCNILLAAFLSEETFKIVEAHAKSVGKERSEEYKVTLAFYRGMLEKQEP